MWLGMFKHFNSMSFVDTTSAKMRKGIYILFLFRMLLEDCLVIILFQCYPSVSCLYSSFKKWDILCNFVADRKILSKGPRTVSYSKDVTSFLKCILCRSVQSRARLKLESWHLIACVLPYRLLT